MPTDREYEARERTLFHNQLRDVEKASLSDRKEAGLAAYEALQDAGEVGDRINWLLDGIYGYGAMQAAKEIIGRPRMNQEAILVQWLMALDHMSPQKQTVAAWKKLSVVQKSALSAAVKKAVQRYLQSAQTHNSPRRSRARKSRSPSHSPSRSRFAPGDHIEISPHFDLWMRGARFGTVTRIGKDGLVHVRMDNTRVRKIQKFHDKDLRSSKHGSEYGSSPRRAAAKRTAQHVRRKSFRHNIARRLSRGPITERAIPPMPGPGYSWDENTLRWRPPSWRPRGMERSPKKTQKEHFWTSHQQVSAGDQTMMDLLFGPNPITDDELRKLIAKRPSVYGRYANYLGKRTAKSPRSRSRTRLKRGSAAAKAWGKKMAAARKRSGR